MYLCVLRGFQNKQRLYLQRINLLVFITETESVYCAVRTGSLNQTDKSFVFKGLSRLGIALQRTLQYEMSGGF